IPTLRDLSKPCPSQGECGYYTSPSCLGDILEREDLTGGIGLEIPGEDVALCRVVGDHLDGVGRGTIGELEAASNNVLVELQPLRAKGIERLLKVVLRAALQLKG